MFEQLLKNISFNFKILSISGLLLSLMVITGLKTNFIFHDLNNKLVSVVSNDIPVTKHITAVTENQLNQSIEFEKALRYADKARTQPTFLTKLEDSKQKIQFLANKVQTELENVHSLVEKNAKSQSNKSKFYKEILAEIKSLESEHESYVNKVESILVLFDDNKYDKANSEIIKVTKEEEDFNEHLESLLYKVEVMTENSLVSLKSYEVKNLKIVNTIFILGILLGTLYSLIIVFQLSKRFNNTLNYLKEISNNNYGSVYEDDSKDFIGKISTGLCSIQRQLKKYTDDLFRTEGVFNSLRDSQALVEYSLDGTILNINENYLNMINYSSDEIIGNNHSIFVSNEYEKHQDYKDFWLNLKAGVHQAGEFEIHTKDKQHIWVSGVFSVVFDEKGKPCKVVEIVRNVTNDKKKDMYNTQLVSSLHNSQIIFEINQDGCISGSNEIFNKQTGYNISEILGKPYSFLLEKDYSESEEFKSFWDSLIVNGKSQNGEYKILSKTQEEIWIQASFNSIKSKSGKIEKIVCLATDITDKKQAVEKISKTLFKFAEGDLNSELDCDLPEEFEKVRFAVNQTILNLSKMVGSIISVSSSLEHSVIEIAQGNVDLQSRTETQASTLEQTSASMEQMSAGIKENSENAKSAASLSREAEDKANQGGNVVSDVIKAIENISESSSKIDAIIGVIDDIAFQTNLLALNAAVEAARAGEQGKGFAVVASEVRNLAQRSASSAQEIKNLIKDSSNKVEDGTVLARKSGDALQKIVEAVQKVNSSILSISKSCDEQASGVEQINYALSNLDSMTQQNSALVEEISSASEEMKTQASDLLLQVSVFKIDNSHITSAKNKTKDNLITSDTEFEDFDTGEITITKPDKINDLGPQIDNDTEWESF